MNLSILAGSWLSERSFDVNESRTSFTFTARITAVLMGKREVLMATTFGQTVAEQEVADLTSYFVETGEWRRVYAGDVDVVYGAKGAGRSAIYTLLHSRASELFDRGVIAIAAENPRGALVFEGRSRTLQLVSPNFGICGSYICFS